MEILVRLSLPGSAEGWNSPPSFNFLHELWPLQLILHVATTLTRCSKLNANAYDVYWATLCRFTSGSFHWLIQKKEAQRLQSDPDMSQKYGDSSFNLTTDHESPRVNHLTSVSATKWQELDLSISNLSAVKVKKRCFMIFEWPWPWPLTLGWI